MRLLGATWIAPAVLSPALLCAGLLDSARGQAPANTSASQTITDVHVTSQFVSGWLDHCKSQATAGDLDGATSSFAQALRAFRQLGTSDKQVEARMGEMDVQLRGLGVKKEHVVAALNGLPAMTAAPVVRAAVPVATAAPEFSNVNPLDRRDQAAALAQRAMDALKAGNRLEAEQLVAQVEALGVPDEWMLANQITARQARAQLGAPSTASNSNVRTAAADLPPIGTPVSSSIFFPGTDATQNQPASNEIQLVQSSSVGNLSGEELYRTGVRLLGEGKRNEAFDTFLQAWRFNGEMDPAIRAQLKDKLQALQPIASSAGGEEVNGLPVNSATEQELLMRQRMMSEITSEIAAAEANRDAEPLVVAERLQTLRTRVSQAALDANARKQMLTIVDRQISAHQVYMSQNKATIDQNIHNQQVLEQRALNQEEQYKINQQIASLVETYNDLMDKGSFAEAEVIAKQVGTLDRDSTIARLLIANSRNAKRIEEYEQTRNQREDLWVDAMNDVDRANMPMTDAAPYLFPESKKWEQLTRDRAKYAEDGMSGMSPAEVRNWELLKQPVLVDFKERPLAEVIKILSDMSGVMMHIDEAGIALEGFNSEMPVSLSLPSQISLRTALTLILHSHNLDFQPQEELLVITSARNSSRSNIQRTYNVKDLVLPIPNFINDYDSGMAGAIKNAYETMGRGLVARTTGGPGMSGTANLAGVSMDPNAPVLGQLNNGVPNMGNLMGMGILNNAFGNNPPTYGSGFGGAPMSMGPGGAIGGGAAMADFATLMTLIQTTIEPDSWLMNGGNSTIMEFPSNLSIVVNAPQTTHEAIKELLEALRSQQDTQVTIEVKFITLNDNFFERMGVDFDMRVDDNVSRLPAEDQGPSTTIGLSAASSLFGTTPFSPTADLDVTFSQDSFSSATPPFGNFISAAGGSIGFAILSDLEMFFFMNAAQGDQRTNILQAPRVTMYDGQFAGITDNTSRPFVTGLIPVVGDFAVAQQPVIVVLNEGTTLNVQATVSPDKRFVRLTLNPTFTQIDRVDTFTFEGSSTTRSGTNILDADGNPTGNNDNTETITAGSTVQQPSLATTSVTTTVNVPDGGTILLGGIKRMREGRVERGVPLLSKIPYLNRLFKNTAIGRETSTLMLTVTPRIILQEEEEEKYGTTP